MGHQKVLHCHDCIDCHCWRDHTRRHGGWWGYWDSDFLNDQGRPCGSSDNGRLDTVCGNGQGLCGNEGKWRPGLGVMGEFPLDEEVGTEREEEDDIWQGGLQ